MTYPLWYREKVLKTKEKIGYIKTAEKFGISKTTILRWTRNIEIQKTRNNYPRKINGEELLEDVKQNPDLYIHERAKRFGVSYNCMWKSLRRINITYKKKTLNHPKRSEEDRSIFKEKIKSYKNKSIVYVDESGFSHDMPRLYGYSKKGTRCYGSRDWGSKRRTNVIGALCNNKLIAIGLTENNINSNIFISWLKKSLIPVLPPNAVIVMDNASFHTKAEIRKCIEDANHILEYLPTYSPDLNPIEHTWANAKRMRRTTQCDIDQLFSVYLA